jgi:hypothetical protein
MRLCGERALVTGGGSGLGRALTLALVGLGAEVWIVGRTPETLAGTRELAAERADRVHPVTCDLRDPDAVQAAVDALPAPPDLLVNNAAGAYVALAEDVSPRGFAAVVDASLTSVFHVSRAWMLARREAGGGGVVVNVSSATVDGGSPGTVHSGAAKAGVVSMTKTLAIEWARYGIRVNAVAAGAFETEGAARQIWSDEAIRDRIVRAVPLRRIAAVEEIVGPCLFLLSTAASYVTGDVLRVDGGWALNPWLYIDPEDADR